MRGLTSASRHDELQGYGEGTLRAEALRDALARFERSATVISVSPDEASHQAFGTVLACLTPR